MWQTEDVALLMYLAMSYSCTLVLLQGDEPWMVELAGDSRPCKLLLWVLSPFVFAIRTCIEILRRLFPCKT